MVAFSDSRAANMQMELYILSGEQDSMQEKCWEDPGQLGNTRRKYGSVYMNGCVHVWLRWERERERERM